MRMIFEGFQLHQVRVAPDVSLRVRLGGAGPAVVLLHGHPRTHTTWHAVAPLLARAGFTVICPDLRGYGESSKPEPGSDHSAYSKRVMAQDVCELMTELGHDRFALVGHDRGSYVAARAALDHPDRVNRLAVLDSVPILEALERADARFAELWWHWFFFASPHAERVITADPLAWYRPDPDTMGRENHDDLVAALNRPGTVRGMLSDYRAGLHVDRDADETDRRRGRLIQCPTLVCWSRHDDMELLYGDPAVIWSAWCTEPPTSSVIDSGHHMAEEAPEQLAGTLQGFLTS